MRPGVRCAAPKMAALARMAGHTPPAVLGPIPSMTVFPLFMLVCYIGLLFYFKSRGGYKPVDLQEGSE